MLPRLDHGHAQDSVAVFLERSLRRISTKRSDGWPLRVITGRSDGAGTRTTSGDRALVAEAFLRR